MRARNAGIYKTPLANTQAYAKQSADQAEVDRWLKENKAKQLTSADNTGKVFSFNGTSGRKKRV